MNQIEEAMNDETEEDEQMTRRTFSTGLFTVLGTFPIAHPFLRGKTDYGPEKVDVDSRGTIITVNEMWFDGRDGVLHFEGAAYAQSAGDYWFRLEARNSEGETVESHEVTKELPKKDSVDLHLKDHCGYGDYDTFLLRVRPL